MPRTAQLSSEERKENYNAYMRKYYKKRKLAEQTRNVKINSILESESSKNSLNSNTINLLRHDIEARDEEIKSLNEIVNRLKLYIVDNL